MLRLIPAAAPTSVTPYAVAMGVGFLIGVFGHVNKSRLADPDRDPDRGARSARTSPSCVGQARLIRSRPGMAIDAQPPLSDIDLGSLEFWSHPARRARPRVRRAAPRGPGVSSPAPGGHPGTRSSVTSGATGRSSATRTSARSPATRPPSAPARGCSSATRRRRCSRPRSRSWPWTHPGTPSCAGWYPPPSRRGRWPGSRTGSGPTPARLWRRPLRPAEATSSN